MMRSYTLAPLNHRTLFVLLTLLCVGPMCPESTAIAQVLKWEIEGTVVEIEDPEMLFPEVRLGDPVRGFLSYDLGSLPDAENPNDIFYEHDPAFEVAGMVIENPRDGGEIQFLPDVDLPSLVEVINDGEDEIFGLSDSVLALQSVMSENGLPELFLPVVLAGLIGPPGVLADASLPLELKLEDWPDAVISYVDFFSGAFIFAEIHTLTPVVPEPSVFALLNAGALGLFHLTKRRR